MENNFQPEQQPQQDNELKSTWHEPKTMPVGSAMNWIRDGFEHFNRDSGAWVTICIVGFIIMFAVSFIPLIADLFNLTTYVWLAGLLMGCKAQDDGKPLTLNYLFAGFTHKVVPMLALAAIFSLLSGAIIWLFAGSELTLAMEQLNSEQPDPQQLMIKLQPLMDKIPFIMIAMIPLFMATWFTPALVLFNDISLFKALNLSMQASAKNILPLVICAFFMAILMVIGTIPFMLGLLVVMPTYWGVMYHSYKDIFID